MAYTFSKYMKLKSAIAAVAFAAITALSGCNSVIYDDEGDCDIHHRLLFRFERNLLFADAFSSQVQSVAVYAFNPDGTFAWQRSEYGAQLASDGYYMNLDGVAPGTYTLVGWCGMENQWIATRPESFTLPDLLPGQTRMEELICRMEREYREDMTAHSSADLWPLFHGFTADVTILPADGPEANGQTITYTMNLMKNTNKVRVILQQLSGEDINVDGFTFSIESANGLMAHHNGLLDDDKITYHPWRTSSGYAGLVLDPMGNATGAIHPAKVAIADLTVARLMVDDPMILTVRRPDGELSARIPLIDYALYTKGNYDRPMEDQEFLDREDTYTLTFFLDKQYKWGETTIYINAWRVVLHNEDVN